MAVAEIVRHRPDAGLLQLPARFASELRLRAGIGGHEPYDERHADAENLMQLPLGAGVVAIVDFVHLPAQQDGIVPGRQGVAPRDQQQIEEHVIGSVVHRWRRQGIGAAGEQEKFGDQEKVAGEKNVVRKIGASIPVSAATAISLCRIARNVAAGPVIVLHAVARQDLCRNGQVNRN